MGEVSVTEPAIVAAAFTTSFTLVMWILKQAVDVRTKWRTRRIDSLSHLLDKYYWPMLLCLTELRNVQNVIEDAQLQQFHEAAVLRKLDLARRLDELMTSGVAMSQPRTIVIQPMMSAFQQISFLKIGADPRQTMGGMYIDILLTLCRERLRQLQKEYNDLTAMPKFPCRQDSVRDDRTIIRSIRDSLQHATNQASDFARAMNIFGMRACDEEGCHPESSTSLSQSTRKQLAAEFSKVYRRSSLPMSRPPSPEPPEEI